MKRVPLLLAVLVAGLLAPAALASGFLPPAGAPSVAAGPVGISHWVGPDEQTMNATLAEGDVGTLWFAAQKLAPPPADNASNATPSQQHQVVYVNLTSPDLVFATSALVIRIDLATSLVYGFANATFTPNATAFDAGTATYGFTVEAYREDANGTLTHLGNATGAGTLALTRAPVPAPPTGIPTTWLVGGGAVLVVGGGAALYALKQRRDRRVMNEAPRRSQVMRELELEKELEKVAEKEPERAQEIKQEIRAQEQVREKRRELQILEAKRADVLKTMDLLKQRHEGGGLTRLQYDNMVKKKQQDLERIEAEIAQMEAEDAAGGGAAA